MTRLFHRLSYVLYRVLLLAYPRDFRRRDGRAASLLFADACVDSVRTGGGVAAARRVLRACADVPRGGLSARLASRGPDGATHAGLAGLWFDVRYAARALCRRPSLAGGVVATLALAIGINTAMFSVVDAFLLRPSPYAHADRLVVVSAHDAQSGRRRDPTIDELQRWTTPMTSFERVEARSWRSVVLTGGDHAMRTRVLEVTPGYLSALGLHPIAGRPIESADARPGAVPVVVLSERTWRTQFGGRDVIGQTVGVDGEQRIIVGVVPEVGSDTPGLRFGMVAPLPSGPRAVGAAARGIAWLKPGVSLESARGELRHVATALDGADPAIAADLAPPGNIFWNARGLRDPQLALAAGVLVLLLIAGINVTMLLASAGESRRSELAVRRSLGATGGRLARLLAVESVLLALAGGAIGLGLAWLLTRVITSLDPGSAQIQTQLETVRINGHAFAYGVALAIVTGLAIGVLPALRASRASRGGMHHTVEGRTTRRRRPSQVLVGLQVGFSMVLLVAAALVGRSFLEVWLPDVGFDADRLLSIQLSPPQEPYATVDRRDAFLREVVARAERVPGVEGATLGYGAAPPTDFTMGGTIRFAGVTRTEEWLPVGFVQPGYFDLTGIPLLEGRDFRPDDMRTARGDSETPVVLSRSLADGLWPGAQAVGQSFTFEDRRGTRQYRVIGVAGNTLGLGDVLNIGCVACRWQLYAPLPAARRYTELIVRTASGAPSPVAALRSAIREVDPGVPTDDEVGTAAERLAHSTGRQQFQALLFGAFAVLAVSLAAVGLFAMVFQSVAARRREMGIRVALGARPLDVRRLVLRQGLLPAVAGVCGGALAAAAVTRTMTSFLYGTNPLDPAAYAASAALLLFVAIAAVSVPAWRAPRVQPLDVIRGE